jgi:type II secretory pathway predicted ATPase ExeA
MYESFFGFNQRPFAAAASASRYFPGTAIETARQTLARIVDRAEGVGLLTGPAGTGKSLLCQVLAEQFRRSLQVALLASGQICTRRALLQAILFELGLPFRGMEEGDLRLSLVDHLSPRNRSNAAANPAQAPAAPDFALLLIVDEAHTLPLRLLEELRLITNLVRNGQPRVRLMLAGSPQLEERFASPKLESFNQRVAARCYLEALDRQQTIEYVRHQIAQAGGQADAIFTADALDAIAQATDGIPRLINQVCDHVLLLAYAGGERQINAAGIEEAWADLQQLPTPWNAAAGAPDLESAQTDVVEFGALDDELADESPAALPFRAAAESTSPQLRPMQPEPVEDLRQIAAQLSELEDDSFQPAGGFTTEVELAFPDSMNPIQETFDHEEVVIDRYTMLQSDALANRPLVRGAESHEFAALLASAEQSGRKPSMAIAPATWPGGVPSPASTPVRPQSAATFPPAQPAVRSTAVGQPGSDRSNIDDDLIVIEEPSEKSAAEKKPAARVRRQEYRQLFAQLRRGN